MRCREEPGALLVEVLAAMDMAQVEFARRTGYSAKHVNQVCLGRDPMSADFAVRAQEITGVPAVMLMLRQVNRDLADAFGRRQDQLAQTVAVETEAPDRERRLAKEIEQ